MLIKNADVILADEVARQSVAIQGTTITGLGPDLQDAGDEVLDARGFFLSPGFIDLHMHAGYLGPQYDIQGELILCAQNLPKNGTTRWLCTLISALSGDLPGLFDEIRDFQAAGIPGAQPLGVHIEGPYISKHARGGFRPNQITTPSEFSLDPTLDAGAGLVKIVSLAPELPGTDEVIRDCRRRGIVVGMCHTKAGENEYLRARAAGATHITHCYNNRRDFPNSPLGGRGFNLDDLGVADDTMSCELICDGHHVKPVWVKTIYRVKGSNGICLVSDSFLAGGRYAEGQTFRSGDGALIAVRDGVGRDEHGALCGSVITLDRAVKIFIDIAGASLTEAVRCASLNPARVLGLQAEYGSIAVGKVADLVLLDADLVPVVAFVAGRMVFDRR